MSSYRVVIEGKTLPGFVTADVCPRLAALVNRSEEVAAKLLSGQPFTVKSGVDQATGMHYLNAFTAIGVACRVERETLDIDFDQSEPAGNSPERSDKDVAPDKATVTGNTLEPSGKKPDEQFCSTCGSVMKAEAAFCPKCGVRQIAPTHVGSHSLGPSGETLGDSSTVPNWLLTLMAIAVVVTIYFSVMRSVGPTAPPPATGTPLAASASSTASNTSSTSAPFYNAVADIMKKYGCFECHTIDKKLIGPSFQDVASQYNGYGSAQAGLTYRIKNGSIAGWGQRPVPAHSRVPDDDIKRIVQWISPSPLRVADTLSGALELCQYVIRQRYGDRVELLDHSDRTGLETVYGPLEYLIEQKVGGHNRFNAKISDTIKCHIAHQTMELLYFEARG